VCGLLEYEGKLMGGAWFAWEMGYVMLNDKANGQWEL
jgi:hypothetical protein